LCMTRLSFPAGRTELDVRAHFIEQILPRAHHGIQITTLHHTEARRENKTPIKTST